jgi:hypothetical protein
VQQKKKPRNFARNKKAFDSVFSAYRSLASTTSISAVNMAAPSGGSRNPAKPTPLDFRCDVDECVKLIVPKKWQIKFYATYTVDVSESPIEQGVFEQTMLGGLRHSFEQRLGELFVKRGIWPVQGKGYFYAVRKGRCDNQKKV